MRTRRLLGASLSTVLAVGVVGAATPAAVAGDNDRRDWSGKRALVATDNPNETVQLATARSRWALMAREIQSTPDGPDTYRLRERGNDGAWRNPTNLPTVVTGLTFDTNRAGFTYGAYVHDGRLFGFTHTPRGRAATTADLGAAVPGARKPVVTTAYVGGVALIQYAGTLHQRRPGQSGNDGWPAAWVSYPEPDPAAGTPVDEQVVYKFTGGAMRLIAFWNAQGSDDLMVSRSNGYATDRDPAAATWSEPRTVGDGDELVDFVTTAQGDRLVTNTAAGVTLRDYTTDDTAGTFAFSEPRTFGLTGGTRPNLVFVDGRLDLTIGAVEKDVPGGGLLLWQQDRPQGKYLERPTFVGGTRDTGATFTVSPAGSITVVAQPITGRWSPLKVKHLPAGKSSWTRWLSLASPVAPSDISSTAVGMPEHDGDLTIATNDGRGVYTHLFDAPRPYTKVTRPVSRVQGKRTYTIAWNTSWAYADDWQVRARVDKGRRYGAWRNVAVPEGLRFKDVTRPRGEKRCYEARGTYSIGTWGTGETAWSGQRCVTVRR